jgi:hypothetical protein
MENKPPNFSDYLDEKDITLNHKYSFKYLIKHKYITNGSTFTTYSCSLEHIKRLPL